MNKEEAMIEKNSRDIELFGLQSSVGHLSCLVDEARGLVIECMDVMKALHAASYPDETHENAIIDGADFTKFVDAHAALLYKMGQSSFSLPK